MIGLICIHKAGADHVRAMMPLWKFDRIVFLLNHDEAEGEWYPAGHEIFVCDGVGREGVSSLRKLHSVIAFAGTFSGEQVALLEYDSAIIGLSDEDREFCMSGGLLGSRMWEAAGLAGSPEGYVARWFMHSPYVATGETWLAIRETFDRWRTESGYIVEEKGFGDRLLCLAASVSLAGMRGIGWSENTIADPLVGADIARRFRSIHGIKTQPVLDAVLSVL